jgi:hypothetical protein
MKITVEISDTLLSEVRRLAKRQGTTMRRLVEDGLRCVLREQGPPGHFKLQKASFRGRGLQAPLAEGDWDRIRELAYKDRAAGSLSTRTC